MYKPPQDTRGRPRQQEYLRTGTPTSLSLASFQDEEYRQSSKSYLMIVFGAILIATSLAGIAIGVSVMYQLEGGVVTLTPLLANSCFLLVGILAIFTGMDFNQRQQSIVASLAFGILGFIMTIASTATGGLQLPLAENTNMVFYTEGRIRLNLAWANYAFAIINAIIGAILASLFCCKIRGCCRCNKESDKMIYRDPYIPQQRMNVYF